MLPPNALAKLRASQTKRERSELPKIARQLQRSLDANVRVEAASGHLNVKEIRRGEGAY
jgi:hypothetical protein